MEETKQDMIQTQEAQPAGRNFEAEVQALHAAWPELRGKELPQEVLEACVRGQELTDAYDAYAGRQHRAARRQAQPSIRGVTSGGSPTASPEDLFLRGFNESW